MKESNIAVKKTVTYLFTIIILFSCIYNIFSEKNNYTKVDVTVKQTQNSVIRLNYKENANDSGSMQEQQLGVYAGYSTLEYYIPTNNVKSMQLIFNKNGDISNIVDIKEVKIKTLFSSVNLQEYENYNLEVSESSSTIDLSDDYVFSKFQLSTKIILISLGLSMLILLILKSKIDKYIISPENNTSIIKIYIFCLGIISMFMLNFLTLDKNISQLKGSELPKRPILNAYSEIFNKTYMGNWDNYLREQFAYSEHYIEDYYAYNFALGKRGNDSSYRLNINGSDYFVENSIYSKDNVDTNVNNIVRLNEMLEDYGIDYYFFYAPNKEMYMNEYLPTYYNDNREEMYSYFVEELNKNNINVYELYDMIKEETTEETLSKYFNTDHHWKVETAFEGYEYILGVLEENNVDFDKEIEYTKDVYTDIFAGSIGRRLAYGYRYTQVKDDYSVIFPVKQTQFKIYNLWSNMEMRSGTSNEIINYKQLQGDNYTDIYNTYDVFNSLRVENQNVSNDSTIVVIGDSYARPVRYFLAQNFKNVVCFDQRQLNHEVIDYIGQNKDKITCVINLSSNNSLNATSMYDYFK